MLVLPLGLVKIAKIPTEVCPVLLQSAFLWEMDWEKGGIVSEAGSANIYIF